MALLERVATLLRANLSELIDGAEDPLKAAGQVALDLENQLLQVKTQVAIAAADQHLLDRKRAESEAREAEWMRKAEAALGSGDDMGARAAIGRSLAAREAAKGFDEQASGQRIEVENLKEALRGLSAKLAETRARSVLLAAQKRAGTANGRAAAPARTEKAVRAAAAKNGQHGEIERLLAELKSKSAKR